MFRTALLLLSSLIWVTNLHSQEIDDQTSDTASLAELSPKYLQQVSAKTSSLNDKLDKQSAKLLRRWQKQEQKIINKLQRSDSTKAKQLAENSKEQFARLKDKLESPSAVQTYIPSLDTLNSSLKFLSQNPALSKYSKGVTEKLGKALGNSKELTNKFQQAEELKKFLNERKQFLKERLSNLGFAKQLKSLNKQAYYYSQRNHFRTWWCYPY